jgi:hypothetical protein
MEALHSGDPRENFIHDVVLGYFAFDVLKGFVTKGLNFKLGRMRQYHVRDIELKVTSPG